MLLHHYGFATSDLSSTVATYGIMGYRPVSEMIIDPLQNVKIIFIQKDKDPLIELIEPMSISSPVSEIIKKNGACLYHIGYEVENINETIRQLRQKKFIMISKLVPAIAFNNRLIGFLYQKNMGLIELIQL